MAARPAPFVYCRPSGNVSSEDALIRAALQGDLRGLKGMPPFMTAAQSGDVSTVKYLLDHGADLMKADDKGRTVLHHAAGSTKLGRLPVELAALNDCIEEVETLFPLTSPIRGVVNWSVDGIISHAKLEDGKPLEKRHIVRRKAMFKSEASKAFKRKEYDMASKMYGLEHKQAHDALLDAQRLDPGNEDIERELRKAMELMKVSPEEDQQSSDVL
nr:unnamed protein product [Digitaria exilis]